MGCPENLLKGNEKHTFTPEEHLKGAQRSAEVRREKRDLRKALELLLEKDWKDAEGNTVTGTEAITAKLFQQALKGNVKAFKTIRETVGQEPVQRIEISQTDPETVSEIEKMIYGDDDNK